MPMSPRKGLRLVVAPQEQHLVPHPTPHGCPHPMGCVGAVLDVGTQRRRHLSTDKGVRAQ